MSLVSWRGFALSLGLALLPPAGRLAAVQTDTASLPRFSIASREDLVLALGPYDPIQGAFPRSAIVGLEGRRVLNWLLDVARAPDAGYSRLAALEVMTFTRDELAVDALMELTNDKWLVVADKAMLVLSTFPYPRVCEYWREVLARPGSDFGPSARAIAGLGSCGSESDLPTLTRYLTSDRDGFRLSAEVAIARIRLGAARDASKYVKSRPVGGSYEPTDSLAAIIRRALCEGPCTIPLVSPSQPLRAWRQP